MRKAGVMAIAPSLVVAVVMTVVISASAPGRLAAVWGTSVWGIRDYTWVVFEVVFSLISIIPGI